MQGISVDTKVVPTASSGACSWYLKKIGYKIGIFFYVYIMGCMSSMSSMSALTYLLTVCIT